MLDRSILCCSYSHERQKPDWLCLHHSSAVCYAAVQSRCHKGNVEQGYVRCMQLCLQASMYVLITILSYLEIAVLVAYSAPYIIERSSF